MFFFAEKFELKHDHGEYISIFLVLLVTGSSLGICFTFFREPNA